MPLITRDTTESCASPGGALFQLPRKIRDMIYRLLVKRRYLVLHSKVPLVTAHLAILRVSKVISREALGIMYSESRFCCGLEFDDRAFSRPVDAILPALLASIDQMNNLEISMLSHCRSVDAHHIRDTIFEKLVGTQVERNTLRIQIHGRYKSLLSSHVFQKLGRITRFRTVLIKVRNRPSGKPGSTKGIFGDFEDVLATGLGPAETGYIYDPTFPDAAPRWAYLEFHPRQHAVEALGRAAKDAAKAGSCKDLSESSR